MKYTGIKADISEFPGKFQIESEVDQIKYEDVEDGQPSKNQTTNLNVKDKSDTDQTIEIEINLPALDQISGRRPKLSGDSETIDCGSHLGSML